MYQSVFINQCGYLPAMKKYASFVASEEVPFKVCKSDGSVVYEGVASERIETPASQEIVYIGDFSSIQEPGRYYIITQSHSESDTFVIHATAYDSLYQQLMKFFYLQRCGCDLSHEQAGMFAHKACHTSKAYVYGSDGEIEVSGGWHDAGDYGRYIVPAAMTVAQLLLAYEYNPDFVMQYNNPTSQTLPDYLSEVKYELDWMLKLQRDDGAVYHKATCKSFCGFIMPEEETDPILLSPVSVTATADFAAVMAMAVRFFKSYDASYALRLEKASKAAYESLATLSLPGGFHNPDGIVTGEYCDSCDIDETYWASAELYKAFGDSKYHTDFLRIASEKIWHGYGWEDMGSYGNRAYLTCSYPINQEVRNRIVKEMCQLADKRMQASSLDGFHTALFADEYTWGSNLCVALNGIHLYDAYFLTGEEKYFDAACQQLHYLLGRNPMGLCYVTGCGTQAILRPHHRPSIFLGRAMPGMLSGGPCSWLADEVVQGIFTQNTPPAKAIADMTESYSTNEVTIYWNSGILLLLAFIEREYMCKEV